MTAKALTPSDAAARACFESARAEKLEAETPRATPHFAPTSHSASLLRAGHLTTTPFPDHHICTARPRVSWLQLAVVCNHSCSSHLRTIVLVRN